MTKIMKLVGISMNIIELCENIFYFYLKNATKSFFFQKMELNISTYFGNDEFKIINIGQSVPFVCFFNLIYMLQPKVNFSYNHKKRA